MKEYRNLFNLDGRVALVVGAASGIGEACAHALAAFGAHVICADLNTQGATRTADAISGEGASAEALEFDVTSPASVDAARVRVAAPDALVITPGINVRRPLFDIDELCGVVPLSHKEPYDVREVIARLVDGSDFLEFKGLYDQQTICGWAEIEGEPVAFIGNNGPITSQGSVKAAQFIQLCCQQGTPIIYLQNTTGYMVGTEAERGGIVKHGSKMIQAVANATVPQITIIIGGSFGAGNYGMCGRAYDPRFIFAWPNSRVAVMGGEQAAGVMKTVTEQKFLREGKEPPKAEIDKMYKSIVDQFDRESTALYATAHLWDDGIIDPRDTRRVLAFTLSIARESLVRPLNPITFGVARM